jgi:hypothetical protein
MQILENNGYITERPEFLQKIRKNIVSWTFEEEYLFFESHSFLGNKWKKYSLLFANK